jgi:ribosomal subunit interface protein
MDIRVSGHQVDTGEALRTHATARLAAIAEKYASRIVSAQVTFGKGPHDHGFTCEILVYVPHREVLKATDGASEARAAFDSAAEKVEKQLRRLSRRQKDHHAGLSPEAAGPDSELRRGEAPASAA